MPRTLTRIDQFELTEQDVKAALSAYFQLPPDGVWNFKGLTVNVGPNTPPQDAVRKAVYTVKESIE